MKRWLLLLSVGVLLLAAACAPQTPPAPQPETPPASQPEEPIPPAQSDPADAATLQAALLGDWSYTVGAVQTDLTFTAEAFEVTTTVGGVSSHSGGTYEIGEGVILLHYDHGGEKTVSYVYKEGTLTLGHIQ